MDDAARPSDPGLHEAEVESRWEAAPAVGLIVALHLALAAVSHAEGWKLWFLPWWFWLVLAVPELLLLIPLAWSRPRHQLEQLGHRRTVALTLLGVISIGNAIALLALIGSVLSDQERDGTELLVKGVAVWTTNVTAFGLWYWGFDRGGPVRRREPDPPPPDFQFPQMENPQLASPGWHPRLLVEAAASAVTVVLVAARAVNILK